MTQDDIFYNNNRNLFLASEETLASSKKKRVFILDCYWHEPVVQDGSITDVWNGKMVTFNDLCRDYARQCVYFYDYDLHRGDLDGHLRGQALEHRFATWWASHRFPPGDQTWKNFQQEFHQHGVELPEHPHKLNGLLNALYSAKAGTAVGWIHPKFISVAHTIAGSHPEVLQQFLAALSVYGRHPQMKAEDSPKPGATIGKWKARLVECKKQKDKGDARYNRNRDYDPVIAFLFPEVWAKLQAWDAVELLG